MNVFTQIVVVIGRVNPDGVQMLGTGFLITQDGKIVTTKHVVGTDETRLVLLAPHIKDINQYQDTSDNRCAPIPIKVIAIDPIKDLCVVKADLNFIGHLPELGSFDEINIGEKIGIFGFPHCIEGRRVLTFQETEIGAKILLESHGVKSKHAVINTQARPGQSGALIFSTRINKIVGVLIGAYVPAGGGIYVGGINPSELNQTTQCISAEYIKEML
jgi:hypothetical protein